jgi:hypothetical protein
MSWSQERENDRRKEQAIIEEQKNLEAFGNYCKGRKQVIHRKISEENGVSVLVRLVFTEENSHLNLWHFSADRLFEYFGKEPNICARLGVKILEGVFPGKYIKEEKRREYEVLRFAMCTKEGRTLIPEVDARFELVIGQTGKKDRAPWPPTFSRWMSRSSVHIADRVTGEILAEDTMYFLGRDTGVGGCPNAMEQLSDLLVAVFGHQ